MGKLTVFLLNLPNKLEDHRGIRRYFRKKTGLRNSLTEEALQ